MKGIILAGGKGTRLKPLTDVVCKQLLPVYDKPMIFYPLSTLISIGITEILIISNKKDVPLFKDLLGDGSGLKIKLDYEIQDEPNGIAEAFIIGESFIGESNVCLILGDNIFYDEKVFNNINLIKLNFGSKVFIKNVDDPSSYGVIEFDCNKNPLIIHEKPKKFISNYAVVGLYMYDNSVIENVKSLIPSNRGELEITDLNNIYIKENKCEVIKMSEKSHWFDSGTFESLNDSSQFVRKIQESKNKPFGVINKFNK